MEFLIVLLVSIFVVGIFSKQIRKNSKLLYIISAAICVLGLFYDIASAKGYEITGAALTLEKFIEYVNNGMIATALFIIVMYIGALSSTNEKVANVMRIRAELSIIATILLIGHIFSFTRVLIYDIMTSQISNSPQFFIRMITVICAFVAMFICIPLFITSFKNIRKKMSAKTWKRLQSVAYGFYALVYIHIMTVLIMQFKTENTIPHMVMYSAIFISYTVLRIRKKSNQKDRDLIGEKVAAA